jgi:serine/threonine protein kinase
MLILSVEYLHSKNIIHKDLKPGNILIHELENGFGIIKIIDFGHSKKQTINTYTDDYNSDEDWNVTTAY